MREVRDINTREKKIWIYMKDGSSISSEWFYDDERKNQYGKNVTEREKKVYDALLREYSLDERNIISWNTERSKGEEGCIYISKHAFERMKQRNGWNKKTAIRMVQRVYDEGLNPEEAPIEYRAWTMWQAKNHPDDLFKFYGQMLYIFADKVLVTVLHGERARYGKQGKAVFC